MAYHKLRHHNYGLFPSVESSNGQNKTITKPANGSSLVVGTPWPFCPKSLSFKNKQTSLPHAQLWSGRRNSGPLSFQMSIVQPTQNVPSNFLGKAESLWPRNYLTSLKSNRYGPRWLSSSRRRRDWRSSHTDIKQKKMKKKNHNNNNIYIRASYYIISSYVSFLSIKVPDIRSWGSRSICVMPCL